MNRTIFPLLLALIFTLSCSNPGSDQSTKKAEAEAEWIPIFNGTDLNGWYTYMRQPEPASEVPGMARDESGHYTEPIGLNKDPLAVFTVVEVDQAPAIRISGEVFGILVTEKEYENYHLKLQFKWGSRKYPPRENELMDSGILYHSIGKEGAWGGVWMKSLECQVMEAACGDYISVDTVMADIPARQNESDGRYYYTPGAERMVFSPERSYCDASSEPEKAHGEWNTMEIYTYKGESVHLVNGQVVMHLFNSRQLIDGKEAPLTKGKIQLQSEGAEIYYRDIQLMPITGIPENV